jgi:hypothetical protein
VHDAVTKFAETIESVAGRIKDALSHMVTTPLG